MVDGRDFLIPETQAIRFVSLRKIDSSLFANFPLRVDLRAQQSAVKNQGMRGACTYFTVTSLVESLIKQKTGREVDLSEEYLAWAAKVKKGMRAKEEDSSVAVNAVTLQDFGMMLERDLPYQPSWFDEGFPCAGQKGNPQVDPRCYSHDGPSDENSKNIIDGSHFVFTAVNSSSLDVVRSLAQHRAPVTVSILGHRDMWAQTVKDGNLFLTKEWKRQCQSEPKLCSGHAALIVGYDLRKKLFIFKNSWGEEWGNSGYGTIPFEYMDQMSERKFLTGRLMDEFYL